MVDEPISSTRTHESQRLPLIGRFAGLVLVFMLILVVGVIGIRRAGAAQAACLQVDAGDSRTLIDIQNGFRANGQGQDPLRRYDPITHVEYSPDQHSMAYLQNDNTCNCSILAIRPVTWANPDQSLRVESDVPDWTRLDWSPDSQNLFYYWSDPSGAYTMGIAGVDGQERQVTTIGGGMIPYGWSADSAYFAFGERSTPNDPVTLALWSRAAGQITDLGLNMPISLNNPQIALVAWASVGHRLAFLSSDADKNRLFILTPGSAGTNQQTVFDISGTWVKAALFWSPDGHYVVLASIDTKLKAWQLNIFGIDGKQFLGISQRVVGVNYSALLSPEAAWGADGRSFVYMEYDSASLPAKTARLMVFRVDSGQSQVLLSEALANWFAFPDKLYVQTAWEQPTEAVLGLVNVLTGAKVALTPLSDMGVYPVSDNDPLHLGSMLELSPNGNLAAMLLRQGNDSVLELAATDGSWRRDIPLAVPDDPVAISNGLHLSWSPDSRSVLMTYSLNSLTAYRVRGRNVLDTTIDVIGLDGLTAYHDAYSSEFEPQITWSSCRINPGD